MSPVNHTVGKLTKTLVAAAVASALLSACATAPVQPAGASEARARLTQLQSDEYNYTYDVCSSLKAQGTTPERSRATAGTRPICSGPGTAGTTWPSSTGPAT